MELSLLSTVSLSSLIGFKDCYSKLFNKEIASSINYYLHLSRNWNNIIPLVSAIRCVLDAQYILHWNGLLYPNGFISDKTRKINALEDIGLLITHPMLPSSSVSQVKNVMGDFFPVSRYFLLHAHNPLHITESVRSIFLSLHPRRPWLKEVNHKTRET